MKFYYVYILRNLSKNWMYVGYTENLKKRFVEHNNKESPSTARYVPFEIIHYEAYRSKSDAKRRELYLKTTKGKTTVKTIRMMQNTDYISLVVYYNYQMVF